MSAETDGWEVVEMDPFAANFTPPKLTVYSNGSGRINAAADRALDEPDAVRFFTKPNQPLIALSGTAKTGDLDVFSVTRSNECAGGDVRPKQALERIGVDVDAIEETAKIPLDKDGDLLVADCSELLDDSAATHTGDRALDPTTTAADDADDEEEDEDTPECHDCGSVISEFAGEEDGHPVCPMCGGNPLPPVGQSDTESDDVDDDLEDWPDEIWCGVCGAGPFESEKTLGSHHGGSNHDGDTTPIDHEPESDEIRHSASEVTLDLVREHADEVETVQELAERVDVTTGRARMLARQADVADQLGEDVRPMGVGR